MFYCYVSVVLWDIRIYRQHNGYVIINFNFTLISQIFTSLKNIVMSYTFYKNN